MFHIGRHKIRCSSQHLASFLTMCFLLIFSCRDPKKWGKIVAENQIISTFCIEVQCFGDVVLKRSVFWVKFYLFSFVKDPFIIGQNISQNRHRILIPIMQFHELFSRDRLYICHSCSKGFMLSNMLRVQMCKCEENNPVGNAAQARVY